MKERLLEFDILKGLLIICVVVGHTPLNPIGFFDVYVPHACFFHDKWIFLSPTTGCML